MWKFALSLSLGLVISGCATWLPQAHTDTTIFETFEEARTAVEALIPMQSDRHALEKNGFDLVKHPNTTILTHADVARRFLPSNLLRRQDLDAGILACLEAPASCNGVEIVATKINRERKGSFWADFFNFQRRTEVSGWRMNAVVLLVGDQVVYRAWSGQPAIKETEITRNPLGPFQDIGPSTATSAATGK